jgi:hypothetical protein
MVPPNLPPITTGRRREFRSSPALLSLHYKKNELKKTTLGSAEEVDSSDNIAIIFDTQYLLEAVERTLYFCFSLAAPKPSLSFTNQYTLAVTHPPLPTNYIR